MYDWKKEYSCPAMEVGVFCHIEGQPKQFHAMYMHLHQAANITRGMVKGTEGVRLENYVLVDLTDGKEYMVHEHGSYDNWKGYRPRTEIDKYLGIYLVAIEIAFDNGMINRTQSEGEWLASLDPIISADGVDKEDLKILNDWCLSLSDEQRHIIGAGEETEMKELQKQCPKPELCDLFFDIFEGV